MRLLLGYDRLELIQIIINGPLYLVMQIIDSLHIQNQEYCNSHPHYRLPSLLVPTEDIMGDSRNL